MLATYIRQPERAGSAGFPVSRDAWFYRYLSWLCSGWQFRYVLAEELAGQPDHGGCGWGKWYTRAAGGPDTAPEDCGHCLAGDLATQLVRIARVDPFADRNHRGGRKADTEGAFWCFGSQLRGEVGKDQVRAGVFVQDLCGLRFRRRPGQSHPAQQGGHPPDRVLGAGHLAQGGEGDDRNR